MGWSHPDSEVSVRRTTVLLPLVAGAIALSGCGGSSTPSTSPSSAASAPASASPAPSDVVGSVTLTKGKPQGGVKRISTKAGQPAVLLVTSDTATEVHVHGADRTVPIPANVATRVDVSEPASGSYEVEDHSSDALLVQLRVS
jgi:hypothetical protein